MDTLCSKLTLFWQNFCSELDYSIPSNEKVRKCQIQVQALFVCVWHKVHSLLEIYLHSAWTFQSQMTRLDQVTCTTFSLQPSAVPDLLQSALSLRAQVCVLSHPSGQPQFWPSLATCQLWYKHHFALIGAGKTVCETLQSIEVLVLLNLQNQVRQLLHFPSISPS